MKTALSTHLSWFRKMASLGPTVALASVLMSMLLTLSSCNAADETPVPSSTAPSSGSTDGAAAPSSQADESQVNADAEETDGDTEDGGSNGTSANETAVQVSADETVISASGIGPAQLGMTIGALKQLLGNDAVFTPQSLVIADFDAIAVQQSDQILFYLLYLAGEPLEDGDIIQGVLTTNPRYQTEDGIGVGTPIQTAEVAYGNATLSHNTDNESREYVRFERHPATNISFTTQPLTPAPDGGQHPFAGTYTEPVIQYNETEEYRADTSIEAVLLVCLAVSCSQGQE